MRNKKKLLALILFLIMGFFMFTFANPSDGIDELTTPIEEENEEPSDKGKVEEPIKVANPIVAPVVNIDNAPVITVKPLTIKIVEDTEYDVMTGVTVTDDKDKDLVARSSITGVKDEQAGTLIITYTVTDSGNNTATATRTITILTKLGDEDEDHYTNEEEVANKSDFDDENKTPDYNYAPSIDLSECPTSMTVYDDVPNFSSCARVDDEFYGNESVKLTVDDSKVNKDENGTYTVSFTATDNLNNETVEELVLEVEKIDVVVTIDDKEKVYFDENETLTSDADTKAYKGHSIGVNLSTSVKKYSNVDDYAITGDWTNKNYNVTFNNGNYKVNPKEVSVIWDYSTDYTYTGNEIKPRALAFGVNHGYIISNISVNKEAINVGEYVATAYTVNSNYTLTNNTKTYKIIKANYDEYKIDKWARYTYNGKKQDIKTIGRLSTDVTVNFVTRNGNTFDFKNAGTYDVVMNFSCTNSNYNCPASQNAILIINKTPLTVKANDATSVYGETIAQLSYKATGLVNNEKLNEPSVHLTTNATSTSVIGNNYKTFVIVDSDNVSKNYDIKYETGVYSITRASYDISKISLNKDAKTYNGAIQSALLNGSLPAGVKANFKYMINNREVDFKNAGTYDVTVRFTCTDNNYYCPSKTISEKITINKKEVEIKATNDSSNYGERIKNLTFEAVGLYEEMNSNDVVLSTTATNSSNAGEYPITVSVKPTSTMLNNYNFKTTNGIYTINKINYDISKIKVENVTVNYDSKTHNVKVSGLPSGVTASYTVNGNSFTGTSSVGTYNVTVNFTGDSNHNSIASKTGILTINNVQTGIRAEIKDNTQLQFQKNSSINISDYINVYRVYADGTEVELSTYSTNLSTAVVGRKTLEITDGTFKDPSLTYNIINEEAFQTKFEIAFTGYNGYMASYSDCYGDDVCNNYWNTYYQRTSFNLLEIVEHYQDEISIKDISVLYQNNVNKKLKISSAIRWSKSTPIEWKHGYPVTFKTYNPVYAAAPTAIICKHSSCEEINVDVMDEDNVISQVYITYTRESKNYMITFNYNPSTKKFLAIDEVQI